MNRAASNRVRELYQAILAEEAELTHQVENPPSARLQVLINEIGGDDVLTEAALAWVRNKKREMVIAKLVALRGEDWVREHIQVMEGEDVAKQNAKQNPPGANAIAS